MLKVPEISSLGRRLVGSWTTEATHPQMPGVIITGSNTFEWLDGDQFLIFRSHYEHPGIPDSVSIIGDTDGLHMHYFDSRGVHRLFELTMLDDGWAIAMRSDSPASSFASPDRALFAAHDICVRGRGSAHCGEGPTIPRRCELADGSNPRGVLTVHSREIGQRRRGEVTCLNVQGNTATIGIRILFKVIDNGNSGDQIAGYAVTATPPTVCPSLPFTVAVVSGNYRVTDAAP